MDDSESRTYRVITHDLTAGEINDLRLLLSADSAVVLVPASAVQRELVEFGVKHSSVLIPAAASMAGAVSGAVTKSGLDVLVDRVKKWLATRPEDEYRKVQLFGPDGQVISIVKTGKEIRTVD